MRGHRPTRRQDLCGTMQPLAPIRNSSMDSALRPMSTSEVLDRTFFLYRKNFVLFAGLGAVLPALVMVMQLGFAALGVSMQNPERSKRPEKFLPLLAGYFLCYGIVSFIGPAGATGGHGDAGSRTHPRHPATMVG